MTPKSNVCKCMAVHLRGHLFCVWCRLSTTLEASSKNTTFYENAKSVVTISPRLNGV